MESGTGEACSPATLTRVDSDSLILPLPGPEAGISMKSLVSGEMVLSGLGGGTGMTSALRAAPGGRGRAQDGEETVLTELEGSGGNGTVARIERSSAEERTGILCRIGGGDRSTIGRRTLGGGGGAGGPEGRGGIVGGGRPWGIFRGHSAAPLGWTRGRLVDLVAEFPSRDRHLLLVFKRELEKERKGTCYK